MLYNLTVIMTYKTDYLMYGLWVRSKELMNDTSFRVGEKTTWRLRMLEQTTRLSNGRCR